MQATDGALDAAAEYLESRDSTHHDFNARTQVRAAQQVAAEAASFIADLLASPDLPVDAGTQVANKINAVILGVLNADTGNLEDGINQALAVPTPP